MRSKAFLILGGAVIVGIIFVGAALAVRASLLSAGAVHRPVSGTGKETAPGEWSRCDPATTSTDCATVTASSTTVQSLVELSSATSYTEVAETDQSGKIDDHLVVDNTLKNITFCSGLTLRTRQIFIDGVDVGQRIAQLASSDQMGRAANGDSIGEGVCNSLPHNVAYIKGILRMPDVTLFQTGDPSTPGENYRVSLGSLVFAINPTSGEIFMVSAYDGSTLTRVGTLK